MDNNITKSQANLGLYLMDTVTDLFAGDFSAERAISWAGKIIKYCPGVSVGEMEYAMEKYYTGEKTWNNFLGVQQIIQPIVERRKEIETEKRKYGLKN